MHARKHARAHTHTHTHTHTHAHTHTCTRAHVYTHTHTHTHTTIIAIHTLYTGHWHTHGLLSYQYVWWHKHNTMHKLLSIILSCATPYYHMFTTSMPWNAWVRNLSAPILSMMMQKFDTRFKVPQIL
jgi:hypothetical protein